MSNALVVIPTYNEIENIELLLHDIISLQQDFDVLVVDDNSPDGTSAVVEKLIEVYPDTLFLIKRTSKLGLGTAYITGFKWALKKQYDFN